MHSSKSFVKQRKSLFSSANSKQAGITMIELLVVTAILGVLIVAGLVALTGQLGKGRDARRKADLEKIKVAFEDYYNDNSCYPPAAVLETCGGDNFQPYLSNVPCDPISDVPYLFIPIDGSECSGYRLYAALEASTDAAITKGCSLELGCNVGEGFERYNYGISAGVPIVYDGTYTGDGGGGPSSPTPSSSPLPSLPPSGGSNACSPGIAGVSSGVCNYYADPAAAGCPVTYSSSNCNNGCHIESNWCLH